MIHDHKWKGRLVHATSDEGRHVLLDWSIGPGLITQTQGGEKNNGFTKATTFSLGWCHRSPGFFFFAYPRRYPQQEHTADCKAGVGDLVVESSTYQASETIGVLK